MFGVWKFRQPTISFTVFKYFPSQEITCWNLKCQETTNLTSSPTRRTKTSMAHFITLVLATRQFFSTYDIALVFFVYTALLVALVFPTLSLLWAFALTKKIFPYNVIKKVYEYFLFYRFDHICTWNLITLRLHLLLCGFVRTQN